MAIFGTRISGFFSGGASGGGGGGSVIGVTGTLPISSSGGTTPDISISQASGSTNGYLSSTDWNTFNNKVGGSGTLNFIPKWSGTGTITNGLMFDNGTSVGVDTISPTSGFLFDVNTSAIVRTYLQVGSFTKGAGQTGSIITNGLIQSPTGINLSSVTGGTFVQNGIYAGANSMEIWTGNNNIATFNLTGNTAGTYTTLKGGFTITTLPSGTQNQLNIRGDINSTVNSNSVNVNYVLINPQISQGVFGSGTIRGIYYNPNVQSLNTSVHNAWENTSGNIVFGNFGGSALSGRVLQVDANGKVGVQDGSFSLYFMTSNDIVTATSGSTYQYGNVYNGNNLVFDLINNLIEFRIGGTPNGLSMGLNTLNTQVGVLQNATGVLKTYLEFNGANNTIEAWDETNSVANGLSINFPTNTYLFGNYRVSDGLLSIDAINHTVVLGQSNYNTSGSMEFQAFELKLTGTNLEDPLFNPTSTPSYLKVTVNSVAYYIALQQ